MPSYRKASIRELASAAYELDSGIVEGRLRRSVADDRLMVGGTELDKWLAKYDGQEIILIVASLDDDRPVSSKVCRTCGTEYVGVYCPRCREARIRLRGR
jgi:hypothetical protein